MPKKPANPVEEAQGVAGFWEFLVSLFIDPDRCHVCRQPGRDRTPPTRRRMCRQHLVERFRGQFLKAPQKMVVLYPDLEEKSAVRLCEYRYLPMSRLAAEHPEWKEFVQNSLDAIQGDCWSCHKPANVAYYGKRSFHWKEDEHGWEVPVLDSIEIEPFVICVQCTIRHLEESLRGFMGPFYKGLEGPGNEPGLYYGTAGRL